MYCPECESTEIYIKEVAYSDYHETKDLTLADIEERIMNGEYIAKARPGEGYLEIYCGKCNLLLEETE